MPSTYTVNLGIEKPATGEQSGTWGDTTNVNFDIIDQAVNGSERVTLTSAGTSGSPNDLNIVNGSTTSSEGRNKWIEIYSASDLGGSAYVRLVPNDAEKILFIRNSLAGSQSVLLFQGTYNASNDLEIPAGVDMVVKFDGAGASATVTDVFTKLRATEITTPTLTAGTADINGGSVDGATVGAASASTGAFTTLTASTSLNIASSTTVDGVLDEDNMASDSATKLATQQSIKAYVDSQVGTVDTLAEILANGNTSGSNNLIIDNGQALTSNTINETTAGSGVTIDSVLLKDDVVNATDIETSNISANDGTAAATIANSTGNFTITNFISNSVDIGGGAIDGTNIGASSAATGAFTTFTSNGIDDNATTTAITIDSNENTFFSSANTHAASVNVASFANTTTGEPVAIAFGAVADNGGAGNEGGIYFDAGADGSAANNQLQFNADHQSTVTPDMVITGSGNVGINTTSPNLHGWTKAVTLDTASNAGYELAQSGTKYGAFALQGDGRVQITNFTANPLTFQTNNTEQMRISATGGVGIGTSSPSKKLHVSASGSSAQILLESTSTDNGQMIFKNSSATTGFYVGLLGDTSGDALLYHGDANNVTFWTSATQRMTLTSGGNLGIGTSAPSSGLHLRNPSDAVSRVSIDHASGGNSYGGYIESFSGANTGLAFGTKFNGAFTEGMRLNSSGNLGVNSTGSNAKLEVVATSGEVFRADVSGGAYRIVANQTGVNLNGDVGIGTASPSAKLEVAGKTIVGSDSSNALEVFSSGDTEIAFSYASKGNIYGKIIGDITTASPLGGDIAFQTATGGTLSEHMRIKSSGNVGLGTTSPNAELHILNSTPEILLQSSGAGTDNTLKFLSRNVSNVAAYADIIGAGAGHNSTNAPIVFTQGSGQTERARIDTSGNFAIQGGVSLTANAPTYRGNLIIANAASNTTTAGGLEFMTNSGGGGGYGARVSGDSSGNLRFETRSNSASWTQQAAILSSGQFVAGTTAAINSAHTFTKNVVNNVVVMNNENATTPYGLQVRFSGVDPNTTGSPFFESYGYNGATFVARHSLRSNGGIANYQSNDVNLSDERLKRDIAPLGSMWDKFKAIEIVTFKYKDQTHDDDNIGVIAQQVESVAPEFVDNNGFGEPPAGEDPYKTIFTADLYHATIKALQEAMARIETLEAEVATLKGE